MPGHRDRSQCSHRPEGKEPRKNRNDSAGAVERFGLSVSGEVRSPGLANEAATHGCVRRAIDWAARVDGARETTGRGRRRGLANGNVSYS